MRSIRRERCVVCGERLGSHTRAGLRKCKAKLTERQAEPADDEATADEAES
jgi:hypothetical protein